MPELDQPEKTKIDRLVHRKMKGLGLDAIFNGIDRSEPSQDREPLSIWETVRSAIHRLFSDRPVLGIDIGADAVYIAEVRKSAEGSILTGYRCSKIDAEADATEFDHNHAVIEALRKCAKGLDPGAYTIAAAIPGNQVMLRWIDLPPADGEQGLEAMVQREVEGLFPVPLRDLMTAHTVLSRGRRMRVLVIGVKRQDVQNRLRILGDAGLKPDVLSVDSLEIAGLLDQTHPAPPGSLYISVRDKSTHMTAITRGVCSFSRSVALGCTGTGNWRQRLLAEIRLTRAAMAASGTPTLTAVILEGHADELSGLETYLKKETGLEVTRWQRPEEMNVAFSPEAETEIENSGLSPCALGLALRGATDREGINLLVRPPVWTPELRKRLITGAAAAAAALFIFLQIGVFASGRKLVRLEREISAVKPRVSEIKGIVERTSVLRGYISQKGSYLDVLREISNLTPPEITVTNMSFTRNDMLEIIGETHSQSSVTDLTATLHGSPLFSRATTLGTHKKMEEGRKMVAFTIRCDLAANAGGSDRESN